MSDLNLGTLTAYMSIDNSAVAPALQQGRQQIQQFGTQGAQAARQSGTQIGQTLGNSMIAALGGAAILGALQSQYSQAQRAAGQSGTAIGNNLQQGITSGLQASVGSTASLLGHIGANASTQLQQGVNAGITNGVQQSAGSTAALLAHIGTNAGTAIQQGVQGSLGSTASYLGHIGNAPTQAGQQIGQQIGNGAAPGIQQGIQGAVQGAAPAAGNAGTQAGASFGDMFASALAALGLGAMIAAAMGQASDNALLAVRLDLDPEQAARAGRVAGEVYAQNYGESAASVKDTIWAIGTAIGDINKMTDAELSEIAAKAENTAVITGEETSRVVSMVGRLMKEGLAADSNAAFDMITAGAQKVGPELQGAMLDVIDEYAQNFAALGISGQDAMGMIVEAAKGGEIIVDKLGDSLKEFTLLATDTGSATVVAAYNTIGLSAEDMAARILAGGATANGAFKQIVTGIAAIEDPVLKASTAVGLFGTPLEDLGKTKIPMLMDSLANGGAALGDIAGKADQANETLGATAVGGFEAFIRSAENAGTALGQNFLPLLTPVLDLAKWLGEAIGSVVGWFGQLPGPIKGAAIALGAVVLLRGPLMALWASMSGGAIAAGLTSISGLTTALRTLGKAAALGVAFVGIGLIMDSFAKDAAKAAEAQRALSQRTTDLTAALIASNGAWDESVRKQQEAAIVGDDMFKAIAAATGDYSGTLKALTGDQLEFSQMMRTLMTGDETSVMLASQAIAYQNAGEQAKKFAQEQLAVQRETDIAAGALGRANAATDEGKAALMVHTGVAKDMAEAYQLMGKSVEPVAEAVAATGQQVDIAAGALGRFATETDEAKAQMMVHTGVAQDMTQAYQMLGVGADDASAPISRMEQLFQETDQAASDADASLKFFTASMNEMLGINTSVEEAQKLYNDAIRSTGEAMKEATTATQGQFESLVTNQGQIDTTTEAGSKLYGQMQQMREAYDVATTSAYDNAVASGDVKGALGAAQEAAQTARNKFLDLAEQNQINDEVAVRLANSLGLVEGTKITDKNFSVNAQGVENAKLQLQTVDAMRLANKTLGVNVDDAAAWSKLNELTKVKYAQIVVSTIQGGASNVGGASGRAYANGGLVQAANGLDRHSRIAKGGANILWAEPETGWEAYISGKPSQRQRNQNIMATTALKLGGTYIPPGTKRYASGNIAGVDLTGRMAPSYGQRESGIRDGLADLVGVLRDFTDEAKGKRGVAKDRAEDLSSARGDQRSTAREQAAKVRDAEKNLGDVRTAQAQKVRDAEKALAEVRNKAGHTADQMKAAEDKLSKAKQEQGKATADAEGKVRKATDAQTKANNAEDRKVKAAEKAADKADAQAEAATKNAAAAQRAYQQQERHRAALVKLGHLYDVTSAKLDNAKDKLGNLRDAASSMSSSIADGLKDTGGGLTGESDKRKDVGSIINGLRFNQKNVMGFEANIKKLEKKGLTSSQLSMLAAQGFDGAGSTVATLAGASKSEIGQINKIIASTDASAVRTGKFVAKDVYGPSIARQEKVVSGFAKDVAGYAKKIADIGPDIEDAVATAMSKVVIKQDPLGAWRVVQKGAQQAGRNR